MYTGQEMLTKNIQFCGDFCLFCVAFFVLLFLCGGDNYTSIEVHGSHQNVTVSSAST